MGIPLPLLSPLRGVAGEREKEDFFAGEEKPGGVPGDTGKEDTFGPGGGRLFRLSQGLKVQPRHKLWAYLGLSLEDNHEGQDAIKHAGRGLGRKAW